VFVSVIENTLEVVILPSRATYLGENTNWIGCDGEVVGKVWSSDKQFTAFLMIKLPFLPSSLCATVYALLVLPKHTVSSPSCTKRDKGRNNG
jgi:hypothetical protein